MCPELFGFIDTYSVMMGLGMALAVLILFLYLKKTGLSKDELIDVCIVSIFALIFGYIFSNVFQNIYDFINDPEHYKFSFGLTFLGGLIGGAGGFLLVYFLFYRKHHPGILDKLIIIVPLCITAGHCLGRIGCFCAGCCYGIQTDAWYGVVFNERQGKVIPTQLFEAGFLALLSLFLLLLISKFKFKYTFPVYLFSYGVFRFFIEFIRGDYRGSFIPFLSPSQFWSILMVIGSFALYVIEKKLIFKNEQK